MSAADVAQFVAGKEVLLRLSTDYRLDTVGKVTAVTVAGASSYLTVTMLEADDNGTGTTLANANVVLIIGSVHEEGVDRPGSVAYDVTKVTNYTQIFRNSLRISRTAQETRLRTKDAYNEAKREVLELHSIEIEKAFMWGIATENTGTLPIRTTAGLIPFIKTYAAANCNDYTLNTSYNGKTWLENGQDWLDTMLAQIFQYGASERMGFCGYKALLGINQLAKSVGQWNFTAQSTDYGIKVVTWTTSFGVLHLKTHPLFSYESTNQRSLVIFEPSRLKYRFVTDTMFKPDKSQSEGGNSGADAKQEEFLTEAGLEFHHAETCGYLNGLGSDNELV